MVTLEECIKAGGRWKDGVCEAIGAKVEKVKVRPLRVLLIILGIFLFFIIVFLIYNPSYLQGLTAPL